MFAETTLNDLRRDLMKRPECEFVDRNEYCRLLVSRQQFVRVDYAAANVRGFLFEAGIASRFLCKVSGQQPPPRVRIEFRTDPDDDAKRQKSLRTK